MYARFKKNFENLLNDLIVICYLLFVIFGGGVLGDRSCRTTLLLFVICYLLFLGWCFWASKHVFRPYC